MEHAGFTPGPFKEEILTSDLESILAENKKFRALLVLATETIAALDPSFDVDPLPIHADIRAALSEGK